MKQRKFLSLILVIVLLASLLAGCGASAGSAMENKAEAPAADMAPMEDVEMEYGQSITSDGATMSLPENRKLIRTVYMDAQTKDMDALLKSLEQQLASLGGYMEGREVYSGSNSSSQWRSANLTLRIPADNADAFLNQMHSTANVTSVREELDDVTLSYVATESRIKALETEEARLLELMEQAENLTDLLEVEARLTDVTYELENYASQLRLMDNQIDYATIYLDLRQVTELTTPEDEMTVWQRIGTGFMSTLKGLGSTLEDIFVGLIVSSPVLVVLAIPVVLIVILVRRRKRKKNAKVTLPKDTENPQ